MLSLALPWQAISAATINDADGDGVVDTVDVDDDNDGIVDRLELAPNGADRDSDGDGQPDRLDLDSDNDGVLDVDESGALQAINLVGARIINGRLLSDGGENGFIDRLETFPDSAVPAYELANTDSADGDVVPDYLDLDSDNDGILDLYEAGVLQRYDENGDGRIDAPPGSVGADGILDEVQLNNDANCCDYNDDGIEDSLPLNSDGGDLPDYRDLDSDNDGVVDLIEAGGADADQDGRIDDFFDNAQQPDGVDDALLIVPLAMPDSDNDGTPDFQDADSQPPAPVEPEPPVEPTPTPSAPEPLVPVDTTPDPTPAPTPEVPAPEVPALPETPPSAGTDDDPPAVADENGDTPDPVPLPEPEPEAPVSQPIPERPLLLDDNGSADTIDSGLNGGVGCSIAQPLAGQATARSYDPLLPLLVLSALVCLRWRRGRQVLPVPRSRSLSSRHHRWVLPRRFVPLTLPLMLPLLVLTLVLPLLWPEPASAIEYRSRWYGGFGSGVSQLQPDPNTTGYTVTDDGAVGSSVYLGRDITPRWSAEIYYNPLGAATLATDDNTINPASGEVEYTSLGLNALAYFYNRRGATGLLMREGFSLFATVGVGQMSTDGGDLPTRLVEDVHLVLGGGAEYAFSSGLAARAQVAAYDTDASNLSLRLMYRFNAGSSTGPVLGPLAWWRNRNNRESADELPDLQAEVEKEQALARQSTAAATDGEPALAAANPDTPAAGVTVAAATVQPPVLTRRPTDRDGDGIVDVEDACPNSAAGIVVGKNGCPSFDGRLQGVEFEPASDQLTRSAEAALDLAAANLHRFPTVRVAIMAHTDNQGSAASNLALSKQRALAVAYYLTSKGIAKSRLRPEAYGESRPVASNADEAGRQRNRRVEFRTLK